MIIGKQRNANNRTISSTMTTLKTNGKSINLTGKVAFIAGVADSTGYGWAIAKALANAGATILIGTWPPALKIFEMSLKMGDLDADSILDDGSKMKIEKNIYIP